MSKAILTVIAFVGLAACGDEAIGPDPDTPGNGGGGASSVPANPQGDGFVSGERLRAKFIGGDDGAKEFTGFFDSERSEDCAFKTAADGKLRCMPLVGSDDLWADSSCTKPVAYTGTCGAPKYSFRYDPSTGGNCNATEPRAHLWNVGSKIGNTSQHPVYTTAFGTCDPTTIADGDIYELTSEEPAESFVEGTATVD